jgi:hypothetical protein
MLVTPFTLCYLVLLLPRATSWNLYDRYLLPLCASVVIVGLRLYQEKVHERVPAVSVATLAVFALWGIAATHDYFSAERAHLAVAQMLERDGIPRTSIQGGFEYDFWTQLAAANHLNNKRVLVPRDAYQAPSTLSARLSPDLSWYTDCVPAIHAKYVIATTPRPNLTPTEFSRVTYRTWLPPFGGTVFVEQFP